MTLPKPCPEPECPAPITHWHNGGVIDACHFVLNGMPCPHIDAGNPCYAPRETAPTRLPDVDTVARAIYESDYSLPEWEGEDDSVKDGYRVNAQAALDMIAAHQPVWKRIEPGTRVEAGQRCRIEYADGDVHEYSATVWWVFMDDGFTTAYVLRTPPTPETRDNIVREFAAEIDRIYTARTAGDGTWMGVLGTLVDRLDALGGESA